jgi:hypothetical protein
MRRNRENPIRKTTTGKGANYRPTKSGAGMTRKVSLLIGLQTLEVN